MFNLNKALKQDFGITLPLIILSIVSLVAVYSSTFYFGEDIRQNFIKQIFYFIVGFLFYFLVSGVEADWLKQKEVQIVIYILNIVILIYLLAAGEIIASTRRWIDIGPISIQPAEFAKLVVILNTAFIFSANKLKLNRPEKLKKVVNRSENLFKNIITEITSPFVRKLSLSLFITLPIILLILEQPSLGNALITLFLWALIVISFNQAPQKLIIYALLIFGGLNLWLDLIPLQLFGSNKVVSIILFGLLLLLVPIFNRLRKLNFLVVIVCLIIGLTSGLVVNYGWNNILDEYQKDRIIAFVNPESDPLGSGWQVSRSKIAIASAPFPFGFGFLQGPQIVNNQLPFPYTDFIYAAFSEQFGIVGAILILALYLFLLLRILKIAEKIRSNFEKIVIIGIASLFILNIFINIGMNIGLMPVTGVPLPLVSYGGSSILVYMIGLGLIQMIYTQSEINLESYEKLMV